ncbi:MAG: hypothetical protein NC483_02025 [Ruminococcus sp.]|nr:hypothetical protein [Ruminococcus sp.]
MDSKYIIIGVIVVVILFVVFYIRETLNEKKGENSEEKKKIKDIINKVTKSEEYQAIYATWEDFSLGGGGRTVVTTNVYSYYAVGFKSGSLYVVPLSFDGGDMSYGDAKEYTKDNVGMVNAKEGKNWIELYDLDKKVILKLMVGPVETKEDKYHPVNINQDVEYQAFLDFIVDFMKEVNEYHKVEVTGKIGKPLAKKKD